MNKFVFCFDSNYAKYCAVAILSLLISNGNKIKVYCLHDGSAKDSDLAPLQKIAKMYDFEIEIISVDIDQLLHLGTTLYFSRAIYLRLLIPKILQNEDKVVYLDSDLIVSKNISNFFTLDLVKYYFAGAIDLGSEEAMDRIKTKGNYINSGVLIMNLKKLREDDFFNRSLKIYKEYSHLLVYPDQDIINIFAEENILIFENSYNYLVYAGFPKNPDWDEIKTSKHIFHFVGEVKPWHKASRAYIQDFWWGYANLLNIDSLKMVENNQIPNLLFQCRSLEEDGKFQESCVIKSNIIQSLIDHIEK